MLDHLDALLAERTRIAPVDVRALGVDLAAVSAHKMSGPTRLGALVGRLESLCFVEADRDDVSASSPLALTTTAPPHENASWDCAHNHGLRSQPR